MKKTWNTKTRIKARIPIAYYSKENISSSYMSFTWISMQNAFDSGFVELD